MDQKATGGNFLEFLNVMSGGSLAKASIFSLSIQPYINASIIIQLLVYAIPPLERLQHEGDEGRKRINQITMFLTLGLAAFMSYAYYLTLRRSMGAVTLYNNTGTDIFVAFVICLTFVAGSTLIVWLGNQVGKKGVGNGISIILFAGIIARYPTDIGILISEFQANPSRYTIIIPIVGLVFLAMVTIVVLFNSAERRIPINYAKRQIGRRQYGGQSTYLPIKVLMSGVMPIIFAVSFMSLPSIIQMWKGVPDGTTRDFYYWFNWVFNTQNWTYAVLYAILIILFNYFYVSMQYNPVEIANQLRSNNGTIPGIRPGKPTSDYISKVISKITLVGALVLAFIAIFPIFFSRVEGLESISMGGTSLLIVVNVALDTVRQLESQMTMRTHKGFL
jgi:preprotein translocase subunit SecY